MNREAFFGLFESPHGFLKLGSEIFAFAFLLCCVCVAPALLRARKFAQAHWTERARYLYQVGKILRLQTLCNFILAGIVLTVYSGYYPQGMTFPKFIALLLCSYFGTKLTHYLVAGGIFPELRNPRIWLQQQALVLAPFFFIFSICIGMTWALHTFFDARYATAVVIAWFSIYGLNIIGGWLLPLRICGFVRTPTPRITSIVDTVARRMGVTRPVKIVLVKGIFPYAAALPSASTLLYSTGILELMTDEELDAITAHEIMHLNESASQKSMRYVPALVLIPAFVLVADRYFDHFLYVLLGYVLFLIAFGRVMRRISRKLEQRADAGAALQELDKGVYARALEKLYRRNLVPATIPKRYQTHPDLYDRLVNAGTTPSYPRPALPPREQFIFSVIINACVITLFIVLFMPEFVQYGICHLISFG